MDAVKEKYGISRDESLALMEHHIPQDNLRCHCLATEVIMRALADRLGADPDEWGLAGLLHDLDYVETKDDMPRHGLVTVDHAGERINRLAIQQNVQFDDFAALVAGVLVVHRRIAATDALERVMGVDQDLDPSRASI